VGVIKHGKGHPIAETLLPAMFKGLNVLEQITIWFQVVAMQPSLVFLLWTVEKDPEPIDRRLELFIRTEPETEYGFVSCHGDSGYGRLNDIIPICQDGVKKIAGPPRHPKIKTALFSSHPVGFLI
jgi:hypothetical protein